MALTEPYSSNTLSVSTTELSLVSGTSSLQSVTDDGVYQVFLDLNALAVGDSFTLRIKEKVHASATQRVAWAAIISHAQGADGAVFVSPSLMLLHGWDITIIRTAGSDRTIPYSIRKVA